MMTKTFRSFSAAWSARRRLALVTVLQFRKNLADRQAAEAVRARIDWKYSLGLELNDPRLDFSVLSKQYRLSHEVNRACN